MSDFKFGKPMKSYIDHGQALNDSSNLSIAPERFRPVASPIVQSSPIKSDLLCPCCANWEEEANRQITNAQFYKGLVVKIGDMFGPASRVRDDGSLADDVLCLKVPELVKEHLDQCNCDDLAKKFLIRPIYMSYTCPKHGSITLDSRSLPANQSIDKNAGQPKKFIAPSTLR